MPAKQMTLATINGIFIPSASLSNPEQSGANAAPNQRTKLYAPLVTLLAYGECSITVVVNSALLIPKIKPEITIKPISTAILSINPSNAKITAHASKDPFKICLLLKRNSNACEIFAEPNAKHNPQAKIQNQFELLIIQE